MKPKILSCEPREIRGVGCRVVLVRVIGVKYAERAVYWGLAENDDIYRIDYGTGEWRRKRPDESAPRALARPEGISV